MLKRMWAIVISIVMLVSLCPTTSVFATASKNDNLITEDFEGTTFSERITNIYPNADATETLSPTIAVGEGIGGGNALLVSSIGQKEVLGIKDIEETKAAYLSYYVNFKTLPTDITGSDGGVGLISNFAGAAANTSRAAIGVYQYGTGDEAIFKFYDVKNSKDICEITEGRWYRVEWNLNGNKNYVRLYSEDGTILFNNNYDGSAGQSTLSLIGAYTGYSFGNGEVLIDNIKVNNWDRGTYGPSVTETSIDGNINNVSKDIKSVVVSFDSPIYSASATLKASDGITKVADCTMAVVDNDGEAKRTFTISWTAQLAAETEYILDLTSSKNDRSVAADSTGLISFTTEDATLAETVLRDDFEDNTVFATDAKGYTAQYKGSFIYSDYNGAYKVEGYPNTGNALKFMYTNDAYSRTRVYTASPYVFGDNETYVFTYRVKISNPEPTYNETTKKYEDYLSAYFGGVHTSPYGTPQQSDTGAALTVDADGKHYIFGDGGTEKWYYKENTWYNVVYSVNKDGISYSFLDVNTGEELFEYSDEGDYSAASGYYITLTHLGTKSTELKRNTSSDAYIIVDDVSMWKVDTSKATHALTASDTANANTVTLTFNQPTTVTADMLAISEDSSGNPDVATSEYEIDVKYTDFDTNVITISGLDYGKTYYLDYSKVTSAGGAGFDPDGDGEPSVSLVAFTMPTPAASLMDKAAFTNGNVTLDYWKVGSEATATFIAAFYKETTLVDVALLANQTLIGNKNTVSFAADVPADADGMIVYALEGLGSLVPLCVPTAKVSIN